MRCPECEQVINNNKANEKMFCLPNGDSFTLLRSKVVGELVDGKVHLYGKNLTPKIKNIQVKR